MKRRIKFWLRKSIFSLIIFFAFRVYGFNFVVLGDSRNGKGPSPILAQEMKEVNLLHPDFIVHTGNWVGYPSREGWEKFLKVMKIGKVPYHLVVGNHETTEDWQKWYTLYKEMIKKPLYYSFKIENCSFIVLCCYSEENGKTIGGKIDKEQFKWLERQLKEAKNSDFIFVFIHEPLYPVDEHIGSSLDRYPEERDKLANLLRKYKAIVFCGHEHLYNKKTINGLTQIITGGAGASLYTSPEKGGFYHYLYLTVKNKELYIAVIKPGNILSGIPKEKPLFTFVQVSDTHIIYGKPTRIIEEGIKSINSLKPRPAFVINTGDIIDGSKPKESYKLYKEIFSKLKVPYYSVFGNHDNEKFYREIIGEQFNYSFNVPPYHCIVLNNINPHPPYPDTYGGSFTKKTIEWLKNHLKKVDKSTPLLLFAHCAIYRPNSFSKRLPGDAYNYKPILELLKDYNVIAWFFGHAHINSIVSNEGINYITTGALSDVRGTSIGGSGERKEYNGYRIVEVYKDKVKSYYKIIGKSVIK